MSFTTIRRLWFAGLWLLFPWALPVFADSFVPAVRYVILGAVAGTIAITEGTGGPVRLLVVLFVGWGIATTVFTAILTWLISKALSFVKPRTAAWITGACLSTGLLIALFFEPYRTPFGRALRGGLLQVLS